MTKRRPSASKASTALGPSSKRHSEEFKRAAVRLALVSRTGVTQIMDLLMLAPDASGRHCCSSHRSTRGVIRSRSDFRRVLGYVNWMDQHPHWENL